MVEVNAATAADLSPDNPKNWQKLPKLEVHQIGHDSEFFLWDDKKQEVVPSYKYYPTQAEAKPFRVHSKKWKKKYLQQNTHGWTLRQPSVSGSGQNVKIFRDGLAVEVNVSPMTCRAFMWNDTRGVLLKGEPGRMGKHLRFTSKPWVEITPKMMEKFPADLRELGCSPSLDAYKQKQKTVAVDPMKTFYRTSGSHLHMSFFQYNKDGHIETKVPVPQEAWSPFIKLADLLIGLPHVAIYGDELERRRRKLYGQAGEFRFQRAYGGLEYRSLSSRLWNHQGVYGLLAGMWKFALGVYYRELYGFYDRAWEDDIQQAINEVDVDLAFKLLEKSDKVLSSLGRKLDYTTLAHVSSSSLVGVCRTLRELNTRGLLPDAGVWSRPWAPDGHTGFSEYWQTWKRGHLDELRDDYGL